MQHADGAGLDAGPNAELPFRLFDVKMRRHRLDADEHPHIGVRFAGRRPLPALGLARVKPWSFRIGHTEPVRGAATFPDRALHDSSRARSPAFNGRAWRLAIVINPRVREAARQKQSRRNPGSVSPDIRAPHRPRSPRPIEISRPISE